MSGRYPRTGAVLLGKYRVESLLGEGGIGGVLKAWHIDLQEPIAIKVLHREHAERPDMVERFMREARAAVKLKGEHIARVLDVGKLEGDADGRLEGTPYIAMEYLDGADLNAILKHHGPQDPAVAVDLLLQACEALAEAHSIGVIHRDIKASNLFVSQPEGQAPQLKILDFGMAATEHDSSGYKTDGGVVMGTPAYMAPEQMRAARNADARSDIWSLGVVLYELLEGRRPFRADSYPQLCLRVGMDPPEPMVQPDVPEALREIVMRCLEKAMERRYQTVAELAVDLLPFASDQVFARASVEQTARMLSRRTSQLSVPVPKLTPQTMQALDSSAVRALPAAGARNDRSGLNQGIGQVAEAAADLRPPRTRNLIILACLAVAIAIAIIVVR